MPGELVGRKLELGIEDIAIKGQRVSFHVEKTTKPDPNTAEISAWNLTDAQRDQISASKSPFVRLAAGYRSGLTQIFYGQLIHVVHEIDGAEIKTTMTTGDGIEEYRKRRINISFGPRTKTATVIQALIKSLGLKKGNSDKFVTRLRTGIKADIYFSGTAMSGSASAEMTALCRSAGLEWSIQDGSIQLLDKNKALDNFAIVLNKSTGLIGSPSISNKGVCAGKSLIIPDMFPGRQIEVDSRFVKGRFRLEKVTYNGDTHGDEWYCEFEAKGPDTKASAFKAKKKK